MPHWQQAIALALVIGTPLLTLWAYALLPFDDSPGAGSWLMLVVVVAGYMLAFRLLLRRIERSRFPRLRAIQALLLALALFLLGFAYIYGSLAERRSGSFNAPLNHVDALYFTVTVFATVGFGDIAAVREGARSLVTVQMLLDLGFLAVTVQLVSATSKAAVDRRLARQSEPPLTSVPAANDSGSTGPPPGAQGATAVSADERAVGVPTDS